MNLTFERVRQYWIAASVIALILAAGAFIWPGLRDGEGPGSIHAMELREEGFTPAKLTIRKGDSVTFRTALDKPFWPASDLHPTHEIYPEFDPREPVQPGSSWTFRFDKIGEWKMHDHLFPYYRAQIIVREVGPQAAAANPADCAGGSQRADCWNEAVRRAVHEKGLVAALELADIIYNAYPEAAKSCHAIAHTIGEEAYALFSEKKDVSVTPKASFCNFGFYHGFVSQLVAAEGDVAKARDFCELVDRELAEISPQSGGQCYHGIGHGTVANHDPRTWGKEEAMLLPAIKLCESVTANADQRYRCVSGAYNGIANFYIHNEYELSPNLDDPLWLCAKQADTSYAESCYGNMHPLLTSLSGESFPKAAAFVERISSDAHAAAAMRYLAGDFARFHGPESDYASAIRDCRKVQPRLEHSCLVGFTNGLMDSGKQEEEYLAAFKFCSSSLLALSEKEACYRHTIQYLGTMYSAAKMPQVCGRAPKEYLTYCNEQKG